MLLLSFLAYENFMSYFDPQRHDEVFVYFPYDEFNQIN